MSLPNLDEKVLLNELYSRYGEWCGESGRKLPLTRQSLRKQLQDRGYLTRHTYKGQAIFGLRMRSELEDILNGEPEDSQRT